MALKPENPTLSTLLQSRLFRVPDYQRAYSWQNKQRQDLFDDLRTLMLRGDFDRHHFMATVVCLQRPGKKEIGADEFGVFDIVDGQQRLTTLVILLKALSKALHDGDAIEQREAKRVEELLVKAPGVSLLESNHDPAGFLQGYLEQGRIPEAAQVSTLAERNLLQAFQDCEAFVASWPAVPLSLLKLVKNRLNFIFFVHEDATSVYTIFEVLNSRGLDVDWLDKCKSLLMGLAFEQLPADSRNDTIAALQQCWAEIYHCVGVRDVPGQEILRLSATLLQEETPKRILSAEKAVSFFRSLGQAQPQSVVQVSAQLLAVARGLEQLYTQPQLAAITRVAHVRLLAVAIALHPNFHDHEKQRISQAWEDVSFRIFGLCRRDARSKVGAYCQLAHQLPTLHYEEVYSAVQALGQDHSMRQASALLRGSDCYNAWEEELRYFFYRYELFLAQQRGQAIDSCLWQQIWQHSAAATVEHVYPERPGQAWPKPSGGRSRLEQHVQRLGNLLIVPAKGKPNASLSFADKKAHYQDLQQQGLLSPEELFAWEHWDMASIRQREEHLLAWAEQTWG